MTLGDYFVEKSGGLISLKPEIRDNMNKGYLMFDDGGIEDSVGEFLYSMVRILKPTFVLETGTYTGISAMYMGQGLKDNARGHITTCEINDFHRRRAMDLWAKTGVSVKCELIDAAQYQVTEPIGLLFLDSEPNIRWGELVRFFPFVEEGGYIFIHDVPLNLCQGNFNPDHPEIKSWPFGELPNVILQWVKEDKLRPIHFPNPRGMLGFYKVRSDELKWI
jgi:hypothetical protein